MGEMDEFEAGVRRVISDVRFDSDIVVSVFETNIRMVGGLLSAHVLVNYLREHQNRFAWYRDELLIMAKELGYRLLPAFNTSTGVPHPRINMRHGLRGASFRSIGETCTACAGTMLLEFAALSRLTGEPVFELKARKAMDYLWGQRHRTSDLVGSIINIHNGDWVQRDSGVGAGIDSYYEYCLKAYILLGDDDYLKRFNKHYTAVMRYISRGPLLLDVHMHRPQTNSKNFMDSLLAFWPGLQVLQGDIKPAIETHEVLYQIIQQHHFLPEAFTTDFQVHWAHHPLRPEFLESTYYLYKATGDEYYLDAGRRVLESLENHTRVPCGFAAVSDVRTGHMEDRMDSYVMAETFKYLYLLFADDLPIDLDRFVFTTEAHLLPLTLARTPHNATLPQDEEEEVEYDEAVTDPVCPNIQWLFAKKSISAASLRGALSNTVQGQCTQNQPQRASRRVEASEFDAQNGDHVMAVKRMGVSVSVLEDGRVQLVHNSNQAQSAQDAQQGMLFMQDMIRLSQAQSKQQQHMRSVRFVWPSASSTPPAQLSTNRVVLRAGPAQFGADLSINSNWVIAPVVQVDPIKGCPSLPIANSDALRGCIAVMERGDCMFIDKARHVQANGAVGAIVIDTQSETSAEYSPVFAMSGDERSDNVQIPVVFLFSVEAKRLIEAINAAQTLNTQLHVTMADDIEVDSGNGSATHVEDDPSTLQVKFTTLVQHISQLQQAYERKINGGGGGSGTDQNNNALNLLNLKDVDVLKNIHVLALLERLLEPPRLLCEFSRCNPNPRYNRDAFLAFVGNRWCRACSAVA